MTGSKPDRPEETDAAFKTDRPRAAQPVRGITDYFRGAIQSDEGSHSRPAAPATSRLRAFFGLTRWRELRAGPASAKGIALADTQDSNRGPITADAFQALPSVLDVSPERLEGEARTGRGLPGPLEDTVLSYAAGQTEDALRCIEVAIGLPLPESCARVAWLMRQELYRELGLRGEFARDAKAYQERFGGPALEWQADLRAGGDSRPRVGISGFLSRESQRPLSALRKSIRPYAGVRLDFDRLAGVDREGASALLVTLQSLQRLGLDVRVVNEARLLDLVQPALGVQENPGDPVLWLLCLEVLEVSRRRDDFLALASRYAAVFSVPAPLYTRQASDTLKRKALGPAQEEPLFRLQGVITRDQTALIAELDAWVSKQTTVRIDVTGLTRIDFMACSQVITILSRADEAGRSVEVRGAGELVGGLFRQMGMAQIARIVPR